MSKEMLINTVEGQECRIAIASDGRLDELYIERASSVSHVGNIYKGKVTNVESAIQAAFIDFGEPKNGFLHISDIHPDYFPKAKQSAEPVARRHAHYDRPPIQSCLKRGQEVIVQMTKEGIGTKGPTMTTYLSIPGRLLVMMPGMSRLGVSRKIEDEDVRSDARKILAEVKVPEGMGFIVRTAGAGKSKRDIQRDMNYLVRLWKAVTQETKAAKAPAEIYQESDLVIRTIRDVYTSDIERIICDSPDVEKKVLDFLSVAVPRSKHAVELYTGDNGLFHDHGIEEELEKVFSRRVELPSGGSIIVDQTEALVAIDVNSGRNRQHSDAETTAFRTNQEAAVEIARQLRLRDLGGLVVVDFIDMRSEKNRREVDRAFREATKPDRAKTKVLRINPFGLGEMTRQRLGPSLKSSVYRTCETCEGLGVIKSEESQALQVLRILQQTAAEDDVAHVLIRVTPSVAHHVNNHHRALIAKIEADAGMTVVIQADPTLSGEECETTRTNARGSELAAATVRPARKKKSRRRKSAKPDDKTAPDEATEARDEARDERSQEAVATADDDEEDGKAAPKKKRRRRGGRNRRRSGRGNGEETAKDGAETGQPEQAEPSPAQANDSQEAPDVPEDSTDENTTDQAGEQTGEDKPKLVKKSRRRGRRGRSRKHATEGDESAETTTGEKTDSKEPDVRESGADTPEAENTVARKPKSKTARDKASDARKPDSEADDAETPAPEATEDEPKPKAKRRRRTRKKATKKTDGDDDRSDKAPDETE